jgi:acetyltransferase-like isoleucine patch superfamily enzyme
MKSSSFPTAAARVAWWVLRSRRWAAARENELGNARVEGRVWLPGPGRVRIGHGVRLVGRRAAIELRAYQGAEIVIEDDVVIEDGTSIEATGLVRIGARVRIGPFCKIIDNHFHRTIGDRFERPDPVPVVVGPDSMIGAHAVLLPGAELGPGGTVGPAAVLSFRLPAGGVFPGTAGATLEGA